jgi:LmbE family N-acetylglucosaminyl deacetylase
MKKILIVAPHPDDETLGCGGSLFKHRDRCDEINWMIMTGMTITDGYDPETVEKRNSEINAVSMIYGFNNVFNLGFPTTRLDLIPKTQLVKCVSDIIQDMQPDQIYLPNRNDVHSDHTITFETVISAAKIFRCPFLKKVLMYEVLSETEFAPPLLNSTFVPNSFSDISDYLEDKLAVMHQYGSEIGEHPFPRNDLNIRALATFRGATAGVNAAEAFMVLKEIW